MSTRPHSSPLSSLKQYPLLDALLDRRSRRFAKGMTLNGGPLAYASGEAPSPLTTEEEAALAFAACGITGHALGELPYESGAATDAGGGNIMGSFVGRTVPSGDSLHSTGVVVINDGGAWFLRRPQNLDHAQLAELTRLTREGRLVEAYEGMRVRIADGRVDVPREVPFVPPFNKWSANVTGTTYFLPVMDYSAIYLNMLLAAFSPDMGMFVVDERHGFKPAGIGAFARSKGGHLDDASPDRVGTVGYLESAALQLVAVETGAVLQNLGLMTQALGLGGFTHAAVHPRWLEVLGFRTVGVPLSRVFGLSTLETVAAKLLGKDMPVPTAVGLDVGGHALLHPYCVPNYRTMEEAVRAFIATKFEKGAGVYRDHGRDVPFLDGKHREAAIPEYSDEAVAATIAYANYVQERYGRFPATSAPLATLLAYQAHHLDLAFYERFYPDSALSPTQRRAEQPTAEAAANED